MRIGEAERDTVPIARETTMLRLKSGGGDVKGVLNWVRQGLET